MIEKTFRQILIICFICLNLQVFAKQEAEPQEPVFYQKMENGKYVFFYDKYYYLNQSDCQFTYILRETDFDPTNQSFSGEFTDFDVFNRTLLKGSHKNGLREGVFEAFHYNGATKWKGQFEEGFPVGVWEYFYPDGKPMLVTEINEKGLFIQDFYDLEGKKRVSKGEGRYTMQIEVDVFTEEGATFLKKSGKVSKGRPVGNWRIDVVNEQNQSYFLNYDRYVDGRLQNPSQVEDEIYGLSRYSILPLDWFYRAEEFTFKNCNIDDQSGFVQYLKSFIDEYYSVNYNPSIEKETLQFTFNLSSSGIASNFQSENKSAHPEFVKLTQSILQEVPFWMPSFFEDDFVQDKITLTLLISPNHALEMVEVFDIQIQREKGF